MSLFALVGIFITTFDGCTKTNLLKVIAVERLLRCGVADSLCNSRALLSYHWRKGSSIDKLTNSDILAWMFPDQSVDRREEWATGARGRGAPWWRRAAEATFHTATCQVVGTHLHHTLGMHVWVSLLLNHNQSDYRYYYQLVVPTNTRSSWCNWIHSGPCNKCNSVKFIFLFPRS